MDTTHFTPGISRKDVHKLGKRLHRQNRGETKIRKMWNGVGSSLDEFAADKRGTFDISAALETQAIGELDVGVIALTVETIPVSDENERALAVEGWTEMGRGKFAYFSLSALNAERAN